MVQADRTIDFPELRALTTVVRCGGFTAAARALGLSKSTISMQITRLEKRLGVRVIERSARRVALTREGEQLLPRVQSILADVDHLFEDMGRARTSPRGTVRMAVTPALGGAVLERLVPALAARYPDISLVVEPSYDIDDVQDPAFDFALRVGRIGDEGLVANVVGNFARILVGAPDRFPMPSDAETLGQLPLLGFSGRSPRIEWRLVGADGTGAEIVVDREAKVSARDFDLLLRLARAGEGIAMVPDFMVREDLAEGRLSPVLLAHRVGAARVRRIAAVLEEVRVAVAGVLQPGPGFSQA